jgi:hypothetical protein
VNNPTGVDLLSWFVDRLRANEDVRRDLPMFADESHQSALLNTLKEVFVRDWNPNLLQQYIRERDGKSEPRARMNLPFGAMPDVLPPEGSAFQVRWAGARRPVLLQSGDEIHVEANGRRWRFAAAARPLLEVLTSGDPCSVAEFADAATARAFVRELAINGLVVVV